MLICFFFLLTSYVMLAAVSKAVSLLEEGAHRGDTHQSGFVCTWF